MKEAAEKEWEEFKAERAAAVEEIASLRRKANEVLSNQTKQENGDADHAPSSAVDEVPSNNNGDNKPANSESKEAEMDVDDGAKENGSREGSEKDRDKERPAGTEADGVDVVEY